MSQRASESYPESVQVVEVGPRDGLQNEPQSVSSEAKLTFIHGLVDAGVTCVEPTAFVHPKRIPQLADAAEVMAGLQRREGVRYPVLVPNEKGLQRALASGAREIAVFSAASDGFNKANIGMGVDESLQQFAPVVKQARDAGLWVRGYISTCFGCPYDGAVAPSRVAQVASSLVNMGCHEISIGDTIGVAHPAQVDEVTNALEASIGLERLAYHFHDTRGTALVNVLAALQRGVRIFDASAGGLGGCPFAPGATGNLATEDLLYLLEGLGIATGVSLEKLVAATTTLASSLGHQPPGRVYRAWTSSQKAPVRWPLTCKEDPHDDHP